MILSTLSEHLDCSLRLWNLPVTAVASKETCSGTLLKSETLLYFFRISLYYLIWAAKFSESMKGRILILGLQALLIVDILGHPVHSTN